jgi:uncharacterized protein (TIGR02588 family)
MTQTAASTDRSTPGATPRSPAEWLSLAIALAILAGVLATVIVLWRSPRSEPPRFQVEHGPIRQVGAHFHLPLAVHNQGDQTASEVLVVGVLSVDGREETASTVFDFIPGQTTVEAVFVFGHDPTTASVQVRSFQRP